MSLDIFALGVIENISYWKVTGHSIEVEYGRKIQG